MGKTKETGRASHPMSLLTMVGVAVLSALLGFAAVYVMVGAPDNADAPAVTGKQVNQSVSKTSTSGDLTGFVYKRPPAELPDVSFQGGDGKALSLSDFKGKTILLNLWATWCAPCRAEMPSLDRLQNRLGSSTFEVVALAVDRKGRTAARDFLEETKSTHLKLYVDETAKAATELKVVGMPTTILIGADGREIGRYVGPAEWDSEAAGKLVMEARR